MSLGLKRKTKTQFEVCSSTHSLTKNTLNFFPKSPDTDHSIFLSLQKNKSTLNDLDDKQHNSWNSNVLQQIMKLLSKNESFTTEKHFQATGFKLKRNKSLDSLFSEHKTKDVCTSSENSSGKKLYNLISLIEQDSIEMIKIERLVSKAKSVCPTPPAFSVSLKTMINLKIKQNRSFFNKIIKILETMLLEVPLKNLFSKRLLQSPEKQERDSFLSVLDGLQEEDVANLKIPEYLNNQLKSRIVQTMKVFKFITIKCFKGRDYAANSYLKEKLFKEVERSTIEQTYPTPNMEVNTVLVLVFYIYSLLLKSIHIEKMIDFYNLSKDKENNQMKQNELDVINSVSMACLLKLILDLKSNWKSEDISKSNIINQSDSFIMEVKTLFKYTSGYKRFFFIKENNHLSECLKLFLSKRLKINVNQFNTFLNQNHTLNCTVNYDLYKFYFLLSKKRWNETIAETLSMKAIATCLNFKNHFYFDQAIQNPKMLEIYLKVIFNSTRTHDLTPNTFNLLFDFIFQGK